VKEQATLPMNQFGTTWNVLAVHRRPRTLPMNQFETTWNILTVHSRPRMPPPVARPCQPVAEMKGRWDELAQRGTFASITVDPLGRRTPIDVI
jgi:hypothetical protein